LEDIAAYIARDNPAAADQVTEAITETFDLLASQPMLGTTQHFVRRILRGIRMFTVTAYPNYLIYYRPLLNDAGVRILYVLHAARDAATYVHEQPRQ
jgi:plasmid stabilization system protein ParE